MLRHTTGTDPRVDRDLPYVSPALAIACLCLAACTTETPLPPTCSLGTSIATIFTSTDGSVTQPVLSDGILFLTTPTSVAALSPMGGKPPIVASAESPSRAEALGADIYFQAQSASAIGGQQPPTYPSPQLFLANYGFTNFAPVAGLGDFTPITGDGLSVYLSSGSTLERIAFFGSSNALASDATLFIYDASAQGDYLYVAAIDPTVSGDTNGVIGRTPIDGSGAFERIVTGIGHPVQIATDETAVYWAEDPPALSGAGPGRLARSNLDGSSVTTLLPREPISFVASSGRLYLSFGTEIDVMTAGGGPTYQVAGGLGWAGLLLVGDNQIFWADPAAQALSGTAPTLVQTACVP